MRSGGAARAEGQPPGARDVVLWLDAVDAISELAHVSPRTFFNYFESKDAAILGLPPASSDADAAAAGTSAELSDRDAVESVIALMIAMIGIRAEGASRLHQQRITILRRHPELAAQFTQLHAHRSRIADQARELLARHPSSPTTRTPRPVPSSWSRSARARSVRPQTPGPTRHPPPTGLMPRRSTRSPTAPPSSSATR